MGEDQTRVALLLCWWVRLSGQAKAASYRQGGTQPREDEIVRKHDNWANYERAVTEATEAATQLREWLDGEPAQGWERSHELGALAELALTDPLCALQEAQTWAQARSALLFWEQRWTRVADFTSDHCGRADTHDDVRKTRAQDVSRGLRYADACLRFALAELQARLVAFRDIRPQSFAAAARIAYLEHTHD